MNHVHIRWKTINKHSVCSDCSTYQPFLHLSPSPQASLRNNNIEISPINNSTMASKCSGERKSHMSLTLYQKPEVIKHSDEGMLKAEIG